MFPVDVKKRTEYILNAVKDKKVTYEWVPITSVYKDHTAVFWVTADALKIDGIRFTVSALTQQQIADLLNSSLLTPKLADLRYAQADINLNPMFRAITNTTEQMGKQSKAIDALLTNKDIIGKLIDTVGKHWVINDELLDSTGKPKKDRYNEFLATNYGFHHSEGFSFQGIKSYLCDSKALNKNNKPIYVIQSSAQSHNCKHEDYSQNCVLVFNLCQVDGETMSLTDLLVHPELSYLASHVGPVKVLRQPGVVVQPPIDNYLEPAALKTVDIEFDDEEVIVEPKEPVVSEVVDIPQLEITDITEIKFEKSNAPQQLNKPIKKAQPAWIELLMKFFEIILSFLKKK